MLNMKFHVSSALTYFGILVSVDCYRFRRSVILFERCYEFIIEKTTAEYFLFFIHPDHNN